LLCYIDASSELNSLRKLLDGWLTSPVGGLLAGEDKKLSGWPVLPMLDRIFANVGAVELLGCGDGGVVAAC
jgi:hypothetical protein